MRAESPLVRAIYKRHLAFVRDVNDVHIFVQQARPLLEEAKTTAGKSKERKDRRYYVPAVGKRKFAKRTDSELRTIYERFLESGLFETFLVSIVTRFESHLLDVLGEILRRYPHKLTITEKDVPPTASVAIERLLAASTHQELLDDVIRAHLNNLLYARPSDYLRYLGRVSGVDTADSSFKEFVEIKATRDLLVHGQGIANQIYVEKAGRLARAKVGQKVAVDQDYFDATIAVVKRLSGIIERDTRRTFAKK